MLIEIITFKKIKIAKYTTECIKMTRFIKKIFLGAVPPNSEVC